MPHRSQWTWKVMKIGHLVQDRGVDQIPCHIRSAVAWPSSLGNQLCSRGSPPCFTSLHLLRRHTHTLAHNCLIQLWSWDALHVQKATPNNKRKNDAQWHKHMKFESLTSVLRIFGVSQQGIPKQWEVTVEVTAVGCHSKRMPKQWDVTAKGSQSKGMPKQRDVTAKGWQSKGIPKQRDVTAKACQSNGMSQQRDVKAVGCQSKGCHRKGMSKQNKAKGCQSKGMSQQRGCQSKGMPKQGHAKTKRCYSKGMPKERDVTANGSQSKGMSQQLDVTAKACQSKGMRKQTDVKAMGCQSNGMSQQLDVTAMGCHSKGMSKQRDVKAKGCHSKGISMWCHSSWNSQFRLHFCNLERSNLRDVSHESCVFTFSTFTFWVMSRTKASFSHLQLSLFEGRLARELRLWEIADARNVHCFAGQNVPRKMDGEASSARRLRDGPGGLIVKSSRSSRRTVADNSGFILTTSSCWFLQELLCFAGQNVSRKIDGEAFPAGGFRTAPAMFRSWSDRPAVELPVQASFSRLELSRFEGSLARKLRCHIFPSDVEARKLRFHIFHHLPLSDFEAMSRTKASFSHLPLWDFEGCLAQKLRFHIWNFHFLRDVSHESFVFASSTFRCWGLSRTKAAFLCIFHIFHFHFFEGPRTKASFYIFQFQILRDVAQKLCFHIFHSQILRGASHERGFSHLPLSLFQGSHGKSPTAWVLES